MLEAGAAGTPIFSPVQLQKKTAANTDIEYRYSTTNTPATGQIEFFTEWFPVSNDGFLLAL